MADRKKGYPAGAPVDETSLAYLVQEFRTALQMTLIPAPLTTIEPTIRVRPVLWRDSATQRSGPPPQMGRPPTELPADPTVRTGPPEVMESQVTLVLRRLGTDQAAPAALPPLDRFGIQHRFSPQDVICTRVERPVRSTSPSEPGPFEPGPFEQAEVEHLEPHEHVAELATDWIPLPRTLSEASAGQAGGLCLEYYGSLDGMDNKPITRESALPPVDPTADTQLPGRFRGTVLSLLLGVSLGLALALVCTGMLLVIHG